MQENQVLRQLLRSLSNFIGDGAGGLLPKLGWDMNDFNNFVNRSETDTAWESYQRHKREEQSTPAGASGSQKRPAEDDASARAKRPRVPGESPSDGDREYPLLVPVNSAVPPIPANGLYPPPARSQHEANMFNDLMRGPGGSPMFVPPTSPPNTQFTGGSGSSGVSGNPYPPAPYTMPSMVDPGLPGMSLVTNPATMPAPRAPAAPASAAKPSSHAPAASATDDDQDPKRHEAYKLIQYHLDNYKRNSAYCLPSSLRPTLVQRTVPHGAPIYTGQLIRSSCFCHRKRHRQHLAP